MLSNKANSRDRSKLSVQNGHPPDQDFLKDIISGLSKSQKRISSKFFYDEVGSRLFDKICELEEYYPTRTEMAILNEHIDEIVRCIGPNALLVEYGSGSSWKTRILLEHHKRLAGYVPIDISREHLYQAAEQLKRDFSELNVYPVHADYSTPVKIPVDQEAYDRCVFFFPGSTIGNFRPDDAVEFLKRLGTTAGKGGGLLIGVDLQKDKDILEAAYNDAEGVTAAFNKNLLHRANRELEADFDVELFEHEALYNEEEGRIEMHLVSLIDQKVHINGYTFSFHAGESIHTEDSYKYTLSQFEELSARADFKVERLWTDDQCFFSLQYLTVI